MWVVIIHNFKTNDLLKNENSDLYCSISLSFSTLIAAAAATDVELTLPQGVYLFLGYSTKDESLLEAVTGEGVLETIGAIQGLVSYHNINSNKVS